MTEEKQKILYDRYPKIFRQKDLPETESPMYYGIACGDGWFDILSRLCEDVQNRVDQSGCEQFEAVQVKEKFGELRVYSDGGDSVTDALVSKAENDSRSVCERCGSVDGVTTRGPGWVVTWCDRCRKEKEEEKL